MSKGKYSEGEMIGALKQMEAGRSAAEVGRGLGVRGRSIDHPTQILMLSASELAQAWARKVSWLLSDRNVNRETHQQD
jgi:hypothetical protein